MSRYLLTIETNCPQSIKGKEEHSKLRTKMIKDGNQVNELLGKMGLPALTVADFDSILETVIIDLEEGNSSPISFIRQYVCSLPGKNTLRSWDETF